VDKALPVLLKRETVDGDADGQLDGVLLTFSEAVLDSTFDVPSSDWSVDGYTLTGISGTANDNVLEFGSTLTDEIDQSFTEEVEAEIDSLFAD